MAHSKSRARERALLKEYQQAADSEWDIAFALQREDKYSRSIAHYASAERLFRQTNDLKRAANSLTNMGYLLYRLGRDAEAKTAYEDAIGTYKKFPISVEMGDAEVGLARVLERSEVDEAIKHYKKAEKIFQDLEESRPEKLADIKLNIGRYEFFRKKDAEAFRALDEAKNLYKQANNASGIARVDLNIGMFLSCKRLFPEAIEKLSSALTTFEEWSYLSETRLAYLERGLAYYHLHYLESALFDPIEMRLAYLVQGLAHSVFHFLRNALSDLENSLKLSDQILMETKSPELRASLNKEYWRGPDALGTVCLAIHNITQNSQYFRKGFNTLELAKCTTVAEALLTTDSEPLPIPKIKRKLIVEEDRLLNSIMQDRSKLLDLISLRGNNQIDIEKFTRSKSRLADQLNKNYESLEKLRLRVVLECADVGNFPIPRSYSVLDRTFDVFQGEGKWVVLEFFLLNSLGKLVVFLIHKDEKCCIAHDVKVEYLQRLALNCRDIIRKIRINTEQSVEEANTLLETLSTELYDALIPRYIGDLLKQINPEYLIIVPHSYLHSVPFEVIHDGDNYWGLEYSMSTTFSLDLARICVEKRKNAKPVEKPSLLIIKDPTLDLGQYADLELRNVKKFMEKNGISFSGPPIENEHATQKSVLSALKNEKFDIMHYIGHAFFAGKDPIQSSLQLHSSDCPSCNTRRMGGKHKSDFLSANEIIHGVKFKRTPIVYLSACETKVAHVQHGDEMYGLVRALMYAGATSLILSYWGMANKVGPIFAGEFYSQLFDGLSVATALRNARRKIKKSNFSITDWGILSLHGDPFRKFILKRVRA